MYSDKYICVIVSKRSTSLCCSDSTSVWICTHDSHGNCLFVETLVHSKDILRFLIILIPVVS